jgi:NADPH-dependent curcumin reductase CurA
MTAYFGLLDIGRPLPGETVVVSAAAGAVGSIVGQIAKIRGCRVVGVAGADAEISWLVDELGFDAAINYRTEAELHARLEEHCPDGVDVYFDNVGGVVTDAVVRRLNPGARISLCGQLSQDNLVAPETGPRWLSQLIVKQAKVEGFLVSAFAERFPEGLERLAGWLTRGELGYREEVARGLEAAPQAFIGMLQGKNQGKQLVHLSES